MFNYLYLMIVSVYSLVCIMSLCLPNDIIALLCYIIGLFILLVERYIINVY